MRRWIFTLVWVGFWTAGVQAADSPRAATVDEVKLLDDAIKNTEQDPDHWAYTETTVKKFSHGGEEGESIVRFDPSKPYAEQYTPLKIEGKPPTERQLKKYRKQGEKRADQIAKAEAREAAESASPAPGAIKSKEKKLKLDKEHPLVVSDNGDTCVLEIPVVDQGTGIPGKKIQVRVEVAKAPRQIRHASVRVLESFHVKVVAKIKAGEASADFAVVDPNYGPVLTAVTGSFGASFMFVPINGEFTATRTEWKRVRPYNDRFGVKVGPLKALDL